MPTECQVEVKKGKGDRRKAAGRAMVGGALNFEMETSLIAKESGTQCDPTTPTPSHDFFIICPLLFSGPSTLRSYHRIPATKDIAYNVNSETNFCHFLVRSHGSECHVIDVLKFTRRTTVQHGDFVLERRQDEI